MLNRIYSDKPTILETSLKLNEKLIKTLKESKIDFSIWNISIDWSGKYKIRCIFDNEYKFKCLSDEDIKFKLKEALGEFKFKLISKNCIVIYGSIYKG